jgi:hypothetical protein
VIGWGILLYAVLGLLLIGLIVPVSIGLAHDHPNLSDQEFKVAFTTALLHNLSVPIAIIVGYILTVLALGVVIRVYLMHDIWKRVSESVTIHNLAAAKSRGRQRCFREGQSCERPRRRFSRRPWARRCRFLACCLENELLRRVGKGVRKHAVPTG